ncbi:hypothetical protein SAMN05660903_00923 [Salegentibacter salinarum]|uniref:hypothetical protein n=1 Tax=Salegentibacter salinarum TaxID=447422 RepID=UPI0009C4F8B7|nr:hypothetical protein [Salegentibacter salinarum]SKB45459.1 hypothetical protein SAMN05660903_00923 [Salegentibacter salinarum]
MGYILPKSRLGIFFSVVNLEQDVIKMENQIYDRGIIPDLTIPQSYENFLKQEDTQMKETLKLIRAE